MQVRFNTLSPQYNSYNSNNKPSQYKQQPSFGSGEDKIVINAAKKSNFLKRFLNYSNKVSDTIAEGFAKIIPPIFDNKFTDNVTEKLKTSDNLFKHFLAVGSAITSGMYMYKTVTNDKLDKDRKNTLAVNQFLTFVLSTAGAYLIDGSLSNWWQKQTARYAAATFKDKTILTDFVKEAKDAKIKNKEIKLFNKTAAEADKKDLISLKAENFIKNRLSNYIVDEKEQKIFMNRVKGMGFLKSMLVFAMVYRYIVPVAVTKPANMLCDKYLAHKNKKAQEQAQDNQAKRA